MCVYYRDGYVTENWIEASGVELLDGSAQSAPPVDTSVSTEDSADPVENAQEMPCVAKELLTAFSNFDRGVDTPISFWNALHKNARL